MTLLQNSLLPHSIWDIETAQIQPRKGLYNGVDIRGMVHGRGRGHFGY